MCCLLQNNIGCNPLRGCIIASFSLQFPYLLIYEDVVRHCIVRIKKIQLFIFVLLALSPYVLIQKYLHVASISALASAFLFRFGLLLVDIV